MQKILVCLLFVVILIFSCSKQQQQNNNFSEIESEFKSPKQVKIKLTSPTKVHFNTLPFLQKNEVSHFELEKLKSTEIYTGEFINLMQPVDSLKIDIHNLVSNKFPSNPIHSQKVIFKNSLLGYPKRIKALPAEVQQGSKENILVYDIDKGLSGNIITNTLEDEMGLWIATDNGLCMFDGEYIETYTMKQGLNYNYISVLKKDDNGNIWIGTQGGGVDIYDPKKRTVKNINHNSGLSDNTITGFFEDSKRNIWIGTKSSGLNKYEPKTGILSIYNTENGLSDNRITTISEDLSGNIWIGTESNGIDIYHPISQSISHLTETNGLSNNHIKMILHSKEDIMYIATNGGGINICNIKTGIITKLNEKQGIMNSANCLFIDHEGLVWIGGITGEVDIYNPLEKKIKHFETKTTFNENTIFQISQNNREQIIITSNGHGFGLYSLNECSLKFLSTEDGLSNHTVFSLAKEKNGNIWMGSADGINIYVPEQRKNYILPHNAMVECITQDNNNQIWIGSFNGAYKINNKEKTIEKIEVNPTNINQRTRDIFEDKQG